MDVTPLIPEGRQIIQGYGDGRFMVTDVVHDGPVIVMPERTVGWPVGWSREIPDSDVVATVDIDSLDALFAEDRFDILLFGCGRRQVFVAPELRQAIRARGPVVEMMDTGAACRTYNLLMAEGRRVAAALLPVTPDSAEGPS